MKNTDKPAYPTNIDDMNRPVNYLNGGLTKREQFTLAAMQAMISHNGANFLENQAERAVYAADVTLAELEKEKS